MFSASLAEWSCILAQGLCILAEVQKHVLAQGLYTFFGGFENSYIGCTVSPAVAKPARIGWDQLGGLFLTNLFGY